jgi:hypothetical protein
MSNVDTLDVVCATDFEEFFYTNNNEPVAEGDPVGLDIDNGNKVDFVLFSNIYWNPNSPNNSLYIE